jgi:hypothetical protein
VLVGHQHLEIESPKAFSDPFRRRVHGAVFLVWRYEMNLEAQRCGYVDHALGGRSRAEEKQDIRFGLEETSQGGCELVLELGAIGAVVSAHRARKRIQHLGLDADRSCNERDLTLLHSAQSRRETDGESPDPDRRSAQPPRASVMQDDPCP